MSKKDMIYYDTPKLAVNLSANRLLAKGVKVKIIGEYSCSSGEKLAILEGESHLFSFDNFEIKGDWTERKKSEVDE